MPDTPKSSREALRVTHSDFIVHDVIKVSVFYDAADPDMKSGEQVGAFHAELLPQVLEAPSGESDLRGGDT